jgi:hemerythrin-like domain-containing protein
LKRDPRLVRLSREHTHALLLAQRIRRALPTAADDDVSALYTTVVAFWSAGLLPHFGAESECLLARLVRHVPEDDARVLRLQRDHLHIEAQIAAMRDARDADARRAALAEFAAAMPLHVRWEEETLFPATESLLTEDELDALGDDLAERLPEMPAPFVEPLPPGDR